MQEVVPAAEPPNEKFHYVGQNTNFYNLLNKIASIIFLEKVEGHGALKFGPRFSRTISLEDSGKKIANDIFQFSSGEATMFSIFASIVRDFDLVYANYPNKYDLKKNLAEQIKGIVVVDEIDLHLHHFALANCLPRLIQIFKNVQFIITAHSPIFLLSLEKVLGSSGFEILELPFGKTLSPRNYSDYQQIKDLMEAEAKLLASTKRVNLLVEGESDKIILENAWQKLYPNQEMNFEIFCVFGSSAIRTILKRESTYQKSEKYFIGLFDFDKAFSDWNGLKNAPIDPNTNESNGLTKARTNSHGYGVLLPVPPHRSGWASRQLGDRSSLSIEFLFEDEKISAYTRNQELAQGNVQVVFSGDKISFAESTSKFQTNDFLNFQPIFERINHISSNQ